MTVIFCATNPEGEFGFMISDDLRGNIIDSGGNGRRCDKIHLVGNRYAVGGFGIDTVPNAVSILTAFPEGSEVRGGATWILPDSVDELVNVMLPVVRRLVGLQAPHVSLLGGQSCAILARICRTELRIERTCRGRDI